MRGRRRLARPCAREQGAWQSPGFSQIPAAADGQTAGQAARVAPSSVRASPARRRRSFATAASHLAQRCAPARRSLLRRPSGRRWSPLRSSTLHGRWRWLGSPRARWTACGRGASACCAPVYLSSLSWARPRQRPSTCASRATRDRWAAAPPTYVLRCAVRHRSWTASRSDQADEARNAEPALRRVRLSLARPSVSPLRSHSCTDTRSTKCSMSYEKWLAAKGQRPARTNGHAQAASLSAQPRAMEARGATSNSLSWSVRKRSRYRSLSLDGA